MQKIMTHLWYDNQAEEAAELYVSLFPDSKITNVQHLGKSAPDQTVDVAIVEFRLADIEYFAINAGPMFTFNESISLYVHCESQEEVDHFWNGLIANGGEASQCGWLKDPYGLSWQIVPTILDEYNRSTDQAAAERARQAMYKMQKLDVAELTRAYEGK